MKKSKLALMVLSLGALTLSGCDNGGTETDGSKCPPHDYGEYETTVQPTELQPGKAVATCKKCGKTKDKPVDALGFEREIIFKDATGAQISKQTVRSVKKIQKPADPAAPAGKVFYGWRNIKNGGQIWNFEDDVLGLAAMDAEFEPVFVDEGLAPQYLEAELYGDIVTKLDDSGEREIGWTGATYSGGAQGAQLLYKDDGYELGSTCEIDPIKCYKNPANGEWVVGDAPEGTTQQTYDPKQDGIGYFVHFNYAKGNKFVWNIQSSAAVNDAMLVLRLSAEYGKEDSQTKKTTLSVTDEEFPLKVNGTKVEYGKITMTNIPEIGQFLPMQDYVVGINVSLNEGANEITLEVNNDKAILGTIYATSPCIDSLKIYSSATITWPEANPIGLLRKGI